MSICSSAFIIQQGTIYTHRATSTASGHHLLTQRSSSSNGSDNNSYYIDNRIASQAMPRGVKKENLPSKTCVVCGRPFNWRKKWEKVWSEVSTCSKSCNRKRKEKNRQLNRTTDDSSSNADAAADPFVAIRESFNMNVDCLESDFDDKEQLLNSICDNIQTLEVTNVKDATSQDDDEASVQDDLSTSDASEDDAITDAKLRRKAEKKRKKAERRAQREGRGDPAAGQKRCTLCSKSVNLLIRCTYDKSGEWGMVCGKCWNDVSGGVVDGDASHPYYRYGGLWKNRRAQQTT